MYDDIYEHPKENRGSLTIAAVLIAVALLIFATVPARCQVVTSCTLHAEIDSDVTAGATQIIAAPAPKAINTSSGIVETVPQAIHLCSAEMDVLQNNTPVQISLVAGTGTNCGTNTVQLSPPWGFSTQTDQGHVLPIPPNSSLSAPPGSAVCLKLSGVPDNAFVSLLYAVY